MGHNSATDEQNGIKVSKKVGTPAQPLQGRGDAPQLGTQTGRGAWPSESADSAKVPADSRPHEGRKGEAGQGQAAASSQENDQEDRCPLVELDRGLSEGARGTEGTSARERGTQERRQADPLAVKRPWANASCGVPSAQCPASTTPEPRPVSR